MWVRVLQYRKEFGGSSVTLDFRHATPFTIQASHHTSSLLLYGGSEHFSEFGTPSQKIAAATETQPGGEEGKGGGGGG